MLVRRETPADRAAVAAVHAAAFAVDPRTGDRHTEDTPTGEVVEVRLVDELRRDGDVVERATLVAELAGAVVGSVVCSRGSIGQRACLGLGPLGVLPAHQRRGVGSALVHAALAAADALDEPAVALLGHPDYYSRFGFRPAVDLGVEPPVAAWGRHFQVRPLTAWDTTPGGRFRYARAFARL